MRNGRHKKTDRRETLWFSDLSDQKFGPQPSEARRIVWQEPNNTQIFAPAPENMTGLLFI